MKRKIFSIALASTIALGSVSSLAANDVKELLVNKPFIEGYGDKTFGPDKSITRAEISKIVSMAYEIAKADENFPDVEADHWAAQFIGGLQKAKVVVGDLDGKFRPEDGLTRAEFAAIVSRANKKEGTGEVKSFTDIANHWAENIIKDLSKKGVIEGYEDGTFKPDNKVTRAEAVSMILRSLGRKLDKNIAAKVINPFSDVKEGAWYLSNVLGAATEYNYKIIDKDGQEEVVVLADTKEINSIDVPNQAFDYEKKDRTIIVKANGSTEALDLLQLTANGYEIEFRQLDEKGNAELDDEKFIFANGQQISKDGTIKDRVAKGDYNIEAVVYKLLGKGTKQFIAKDKGVVSIVDNLADKIATVKDYELETTEKVKVKNSTLAFGETAEFKKLLVDLPDKKDVDVIADKVDYNLESSNPDVIEVNDNNTLTAKSVGEATITIKVGKAKKDIKLKVAKEERKISSLKDAGEVRLAGAGATKTIAFDVLDQYGDVYNAALKDIELTSDDKDWKNNLEVKPSYDEVNKKNLLTVTAKDGIKVPYASTIYVSQTDDKDPELKKEIGKIRVVVGDQIGKANFKLSPKAGYEAKVKKDKLTQIELIKEDSKGNRVKLDGTDKEKITEIFSSDESIAKIVGTVPGEPEKEGTLTTPTTEFAVKGLKEGKVTITAKVGGKTYTLDVTVEPEEQYNATKVSFNTDENLNAVKEYKLSDLIDLENITHDKPSVTKVTLKDGDLNVGDSKIGSISVQIINYKDGKLESEDLRQPTSIKNIEESIIKEEEAKDARKDIKVIVKDNNGKDVGSKTYKLDTLN